MPRILVAVLVGCGSVEPAAPTVATIGTEPGVGASAAPMRVDADGACHAAALPSLDVALRESAYDAEEVDPALATEPYCLGPSSERGVGDPFPFKRHHVKVPEAGATRDDLVLFLTGSGGECDAYEVLPRLAAASGHRSICLGYPNETMVADRCDATDDPDCWLDVRAEVLYGEDRSELVEITRPNSIEGRLAALLAFLADEDPAGGWERYLAGEDVRWERVAAMGFSQGAGHVGLLGRDHRLARAVMLSGAGDADADGVVDWGYDARATPAGATFLYWHAAEPIAPLMAEVADLWLGAAPIDADGEAYPFGCAHAATTSRETSHAHGAVAWDPYLDLGEDGWPIDADVHLWHLLAPVGER